MSTADQVPFSRLPIYERDMDDITGFVLKDEMLAMDSGRRGDVKLAALRRELLAVPETISLSSLLEFLLKHRQHITVVVDEYGGTAGVVTLEDVLETLLGMEISDEMDNVEDMRLMARQRWEARVKELGLNLAAVSEESE